jgi:hypothetical protein
VDVPGSWPGRPASVPRLFTSVEGPLPPLGDGLPPLVNGLPPPGDGLPLLVNEFPVGGARPPEGRCGPPFTEEGSGSGRRRSRPLGADSRARRIQSRRKRMPLRARGVRSRRKRLRSRRKEAGSWARGSSPPLRGTGSRRGRSTSRAGEVTPPKKGLTPRSVTAPHGDLTDGSRSPRHSRTASPPSTAPRRRRSPPSPGCASCTRWVARGRALLD